MPAYSTQFFVTQFENTTPLAQHCDTEPDFDFGGARWRVETKGESPDWRVKFRVLEGQAPSCNVGVEFVFESWTLDNYLMMPAAVYAGNRFRASTSHREDSVTDFGPQMPIVISPKERLNIGAGESRIEFRSGDAATPAVAVYFAAQKRGFLLLFDQGNELGNYGIVFEENDERTRATLRICAPCVRRGELGEIKGDRAHDFQAGEEVEFRFRVFDFECQNINGLFDKFFAHRNDLRVAREQHEIPFGACWQIQQRKYNEQNWVEEYGYYSVGMREVSSQNWQTAWTGGMNAVYPLLCEGDKFTRARAKRTFDFLLNGGVFPSGFLRGGFHDGVWNNGKTLLARYNADALFFLMKSFRLLEACGETVRPQWKQMARGIAQAFGKQWKEQGQLGHRIQGETGKILWGQTCSASTAVGGLALASDYFGEPEFLEIARQSGEHFYRNFVSAGITNAGPGDALQCPDSESCFGLLESFTTLSDVTGQAQWMDYARDVAHQGASWTMSYDFRFPSASTFGQLGMLTTGTVWANIQNKHSAPGICSLSGIGLLKLFRATGDVRYLHLIQEIAHAIPQYLSRADRPIRDVRPGQRWPVMAPGWINERVNTSDWEVRGQADAIGVGEIFGGSTWSEVAMLLTFAELPGVYWQTDSDVLCVLDHVEARVDDGKLHIFNPTEFDAEVKVLAETSDASKTPLDAIAGWDWPRVTVAAGQTVQFRN